MAEVETPKREEPAITAPGQEAEPDPLRPSLAVRWGTWVARAVILDATLVRPLVVPAVMQVAGGRANWWLPGFLERILPQVRVD